MSKDRAFSLYLPILVVALVHGLMYVFGVPLWEHFDEPGHFDYVWLVANRADWPQAGDYDNAMRRKLAKSMLESGFIERHRIPQVNLRDLSQEIWVPFSQTGDRPLYYWLAAWPLRLLKHTPIDTQAYTARLVSLLLFLSTIVASIGFAAELSPPDSPLRWLLPAFIALLPGFVDFMTAINNHVLAITIFSFWLWLAVRLVIKGPRWLELLALTAVTALAFFTQLSSWVVIGLYPLAVILTFMRRKRWLLLAIAGVLVILLPFVLVRLNNPAYWIPQLRQKIPWLVQNNPSSPLPSALQLQVASDKEWGVNDPFWHNGVFQIIPPAEASLLVGNNVTIGAWVWADRDIQVYGPGINLHDKQGDHWYGFPLIQVGPEPVFIAVHIRLPQQTGNLQVWLRATSPEDEGATLNFSGVVLAQGYHPLKTAPVFPEPDLPVGEWGKGTVRNLARNPFFRQTWPALAPWLQALEQQGYFNFNSSSFPTLVSSLLDPAWRWYPAQLGAYLFRTFWDSYGWGGSRLVAIPGILHYPYRILGGITLLCLTGFILHLTRHHKEQPWAVYVLLGLTILSVLVLVYSYGLLTFGGALRYRVHFPSARFIYPVILPLSLALCTGWLGWIDAIRRLKKYNQQAGLALVVFQLVFASYAWYSLLARW